MRNVADDLAAYLELIVLPVPLVRAENLFIGMLPEAEGVPSNCVALLTSGGNVTPIVGQGKRAIIQAEVLVQVRGEVEAYEATLAQANAVWEALNQQTLEPYISLTCNEGTPSFDGTDAAHRPAYSFHVEATFYGDDETAPSGIAVHAEQVVLDPVVGLDATNVQDAIEELAGSGGGGGGGGHIIRDEGADVPKRPVLDFKGAGVTVTDDGPNVSSVVTIPGVGLAPVGDAPNPSGATVVDGVLSLQPADATNPGLLTPNAQVISGPKDFTGPVTVDGDFTASGNATLQPDAAEGVTMDGRTYPRTENVGLVRSMLTAAADGTRAAYFDIDVNGRSDARATAVDFHATKLKPGQYGVAHSVSLDTADSTGGRMSALVVSKNSSGLADATAVAVEGIVNPVVHKTGVPVAPSSAFKLVGAVYTDITAACGGSGENVAVLSGTNDDLLIGLTVQFAAIEVQLATVSNRSVTPEFAYSTGDGTWATFGPIDQTNGFSASGAIVWYPVDLVGWAKATVSGVGNTFWIRIRRIRNTNAAAEPIESSIKPVVVTTHQWDKFGALNVASVTAPQINPTAATATPGTGTITASGVYPVTVTGTGTSFTTQITPGDVLTANGVSRVVSKVVSNTSLQLADGGLPVWTAQAFTITKAPLVVRDAAGADQWKVSAIGSLHQMVAPGLLTPQGSIQVREGAMIVNADQPDRSINFANGYVSIRGYFSVNTFVAAPGDNGGSFRQSPSSSAIGLTYMAGMLDGASRWAHTFDNQSLLNNATAYIARWRHNQVTQLELTKEAKFIHTTTDSTATPGNVTQSTVHGSVAIASGASTVTVTNALITAASVVSCSISGASDDSTLTSIRWRVAAGSLVITGNAAATDTVRVNYKVTN